MIVTLFRLVAVVSIGALALGAVGWLPRLLGLTQAEANRPSKARLPALDGLRGALALGVIAAHLDAFHHLFTRGTWQAPDEPLLVAGEVAVSLFFGITGFLFWDRAIDGRIQARTLYPRRLLRVYPLYLAIVVAGVIASLLKRPFEDDVWNLSIVLTRLAVPGRGLDDAINGVDVTRWLSQAWTLHYELAFYLLLPLLAPMARRRGSAFWLAAASIVLQARLPHGTPFDPHLRLVLPLFTAGMIAAETARWTPAVEALRGPLGGQIAIGGVAVYFLLPPGYPPLAAFAAFAILAPFACGGDPFGIFSRPAWRRLGEISYSVYLTHNPVLFIGLTAVAAFVPIGSLPEPLYWVIGAALVVLVVALSLLTFRFLERPFIGLRSLPATDAAP